MVSAKVLGTLTIEKTSVKDLHTLFTISRIVNTTIILAVR